MSILLLFLLIVAVSATSILCSGEVLQEITTPSSSSASHSDSELAPSNIVELNDDNFESITHFSASLRSYFSHQQNNNEENDWMFYFYSSSCFHCLRASPAIDMFATNYYNQGKHNVRVGRINCDPTADAELASATIKLCRLRFKANAFPTLLFVWNVKKKRQIINFVDFKKRNVASAEDLLEFVSNKENQNEEVQSKFSNRPRPWSDERLKSLMESESVSGSLYDWIAVFIEEVNDEVTARSGGRVNPIVFWIVFDFAATSLVVILLVTLCDCKGGRRRRVSEIMEERKKLSQKDKKEQ
jgi:hypothetical protein